MGAAPGRSVMVVADVHDRHAAAERAVASESPGAVVFLGDYFDGGGDPKETAAWLAASMEREGRVHLLGNHDVHYMSPNRGFRCTGYDSAVLDAISSAGVPWGRAVPYCWLDERWLCTHAGLSAALVRACARAPGRAGAVQLLAGAYSQMESARAGGGAPLFEAGRSRGGSRGVGGITWCDYSEFEDVPGMCQIFGHTRGARVRGGRRPGSEHYCIDTSMNHYAVYRDGSVAVKGI